VRERSCIALDVKHFRVEDERLEHALAHPVWEERCHIGAKELLDGLQLVLLEIVASLTIGEESQELFFLQATLLLAVTLVLIFDLVVKNLLDDVLQGDEADLFQVGIHAFIVANFSDDSQMIVTVFKALQRQQARLSVVDVYNITQGARQLLHGQLVAIRVEQNQILGHEHAYDVVFVAFVDGDATVARSVDLLRHLAIDHRVYLKHVCIVNRQHYVLDLLGLQLERGSEDTSLVIIDHADVSLLLEEFLHFGLVHDFAFFLAEGLVEDGRDRVREHKRDDQGNPQKPTQIRASSHTVAGADCLRQDLTKDDDESSRGYKSDSTTCDVGHQN